MTAPTPHDIASLAFTRRRDPDLALSIAEQSGKAHDQTLISSVKDERDERSSSRKTNAR